MVVLLRPTAVKPRPIFDRTAGDVEIHELHPQEAAIIRVDAPVAELPSVIGDALREVSERMATAGVDLAGPPFTRYPSFGPDTVTAECGFPVMRPAPVAGRVVSLLLPGGLAASIIHLGPYETLDQTYDQLQRSLDGSGLHAAGPMWEIYWTDPGMEPDAQRWRTEIVVPLETPAA
jgi:effector-binding domain-containing protein